MKTSIIINGVAHCYDLATRKIGPMPCRGRQAALQPWSDSVRIAFSGVLAAYDTGDEVKLVSACARLRQAAVNQSLSKNVKGHGTRY